jgi:hypothetical protein
MYSVQRILKTWSQFVCNAVSLDTLYLYVLYRHVCPAIRYRQLPVGEQLVSTSATAIVLRRLAQQCNAN